MVNQNVTLGVDLGTTNSAVAIVEGGEAEILENREGTRTTPSVVRFSELGNDEDTAVVGKPAQNRAMEQPERTVTSIKRHMGEADYTVSIDDIEYKPEEISGHILGKLQSDMADRLGLDEASLTSIVVTVPAYFTEDSRQATRDAAQIAGFEQINIINEPSASAMAYGYHEDSDRETILVYDLGGGTFDVSVLTIGDGLFEVQATNGIRSLGGDDWDQRVVDWMRKDIQQQHGFDPLNGYDSREAIKQSDDIDLLLTSQRLYEKARDQKESLAVQKGGRTRFHLPGLNNGNGGTETYSGELTHHEFREITEDLLQQTVDPTLDTIQEAGIKPSDLDEILLVGGATRMRQVEDLIQETLNHKPNRTVNPDEAVAQGAAIHGNMDEILLQEVTPLSLGIEVKSGGFERLIHRNTTLPAEQERVFTTAEDGRTSIRIDVYQGEREIAKENRHLKEFYLNGIPPQPRGMPSIKVTFRVSASGLVTARAEDLSSASQDAVEEVTIEGVNNLSDSEVNQLIEKAEQHAEEDQQRRQLKEKQQAAEEQIYQANRLLEEYGEHLSDEQVEKLHRHADRAGAGLEDQRITAGELEQRTEALYNLILEFGEAIQTNSSTDTSSSDEHQSGDEVTKPENNSSSQGTEPTRDTSTTGKSRSEPPESLSSSDGPNAETRSPSTPDDVPTESPSASPIEQTQSSSSDSDVISIPNGEQHSTADSVSAEEDPSVDTGHESEPTAQPQQTSSIDNTTQKEEGSPATEATSNDQGEGQTETDSTSENTNRSTKPDAEDDLYGIGGGDYSNSDSSSDEEGDERDDQIGGEETISDSANEAESDNKDRSIPEQSENTTESVREGDPSAAPYTNKHTEGTEFDQTSNDGEMGGLEEESDAEQDAPESNATQMVDTSTQESVVDDSIDSEGSSEDDEDTEHLSTTKEDDQVQQTTLAETNESEDSESEQENEETSDSGTYTDDLVDL